jgi:FKBP-type peptidyl-prolyl cis-trans isomerase FkpA
MTPNVEVEVSQRLSWWMRTALAVVLLTALAVALAGCGTKANDTSDTTSSEQSTTQEQPAEQTTPPPTQTTTPTADVTELKIEDLVVGTGAAAKVGDTVTVNYTGWLTDGTQFDSSVGRAPFSFTIGQRRVIQGWEQGVPGMKVGGKRKLTIPPDLGYGAQGAGGGAIPPNATLVFEVELLKIN